ncbi:hypothetical protein BDA96_02G429500 [Sorghum bicolor]|uniref:Adenylyl cyclase n=2 Tax=Sorghum bicolor TaxID=4558 RepID=A0A921RV16_SORBI|nr:uncharacterized protein LOC8078515 isoform X2 [Sorghum bicolor]KAG0546229.1 hypothetical protein BDA96_02G429500 [Sorghum bicolor]KXG36891.1 hypothetical protein SORBI_3002G408900 [Sorghum bicolor]|eukprot:XP_021308846.1 uncharacterized protein LOC8078515 isoform X2 [Sorghum bicolor]
MKAMLHLLLRPPLALGMKATEAALRLGLSAMAGQSQARRLLLPPLASRLAPSPPSSAHRPVTLRNLLSPTIASQCLSEKSVHYHITTTHFSTEASDMDHPTEEMYQKMLKSVEAKTMPPNAWLWSMIDSCSNKEDIKLLFQILQKLRVFRLSNLRISANFNENLCRKVTEACARAGAIEYGLKALWTHNVYGITPTIGSAHYLLQHAKEQNDTKLMENVIHVLSRNSLPLQPGTADIVFSICYNADRWDLLSKYGERFIKAGVKLHRAAFDIWMDFAAKVGDSQSIWNINSLRGRSVKHYTLASGFACAKGSLLDRNPENAAAMIKLLYKHLPDQKKPFVKDELEKLIAEWPTEVVKRQKKDNRKTLEEALIKDIPTMVDCLTKFGLDIPVDLDKLPTPQLQVA